MPLQLISKAIVVHERPTGQHAWKFFWCSLVRLSWSMFSSGQSITAGLLEAVFHMVLAEELPTSLSNFAAYTVTY
jgi:hypothetical protein